MNEDKQFQFIAVILLAFALSLAFVPVCHAQSEDSSRSDDTADSGSGDDMSSGEADTVGIGDLSSRWAKSYSARSAPVDSKHGRCVPR